MSTSMMPVPVDPTRLLQAFKAYPTYSRFESLLEPHRVPPQAVIQAVYDEVMLVIGGIQKGCAYTTETLCGERLWQRWPHDGLHRAMGICLSFLVESGHLPLVCTQRRSRQTKRYRLIDPDEAKLLIRRVPPMTTVVG